MLSVVVQTVGWRGQKREKLLLSSRKKRETEQKRNKWMTHGSRDNQGVFWTRSANLPFLFVRETQWWAMQSHAGTTPTSIFGLMALCCMEGLGHRWAGKSLTTCSLGNESLVGSISNSRAVNTSIMVISKLVIWPTEAELGRNAHNWGPGLQERREKRGKTTNTRAKDRNSTRLKSKDRMTTKNESNSQESVHIIERMLFPAVCVNLHNPVS